MPIIRRAYCVYATLVFFTLEQLDSFENYKVLCHRMENITYKREIESQKISYVNYIIRSYAM